jgi:hypothetical protein
MGRFKRRNGLRALDMVQAIGAIFIVAAFLVLSGASFSFNFLGDYISLIPSLILIFVGIYTLSNTQGLVVLGGFLMLGIGFAYLTGMLNTLGILIPDIITPNLTLGNIQLLIVVFSGVIGSIYSSY